MTPTEFRAALADLGLTQTALAALVAVTDRTARRWASGDQEVPRSTALLLRLMMRFPAVRRWVGSA